MVAGMVATRVVPLISMMALHWVVPKGSKSVVLLAVRWALLLADLMAELSAVSTAEHLDVLLVAKMADSKAEPTAGGLVGLRVD